MKTKASIF